MLFHPPHPSHLLFVRSPPLARTHTHSAFGLGRKGRAGVSACFIVPHPNAMATGFGCRQAERGQFLFFCPVCESRTATVRKQGLRVPGKSARGEGAEWRIALAQRQGLSPHPSAVCPTAQRSPPLPQQHPGPVRHSLIRAAPPFPPLSSRGEPPENAEGQTRKLSPPAPEAVWVAEARAPREPRWDTALRGVRASQSALMGADWLLLTRTTAHN